MVKDNILLLKLKMLWLYRFDIVRWYRDVWVKNDHDYYCCSGAECGCCGMMYYDIWESAIANDKAVRKI